MADEFEQVSEAAGPDALTEEDRRLLAGDAVGEDAEGEELAEADSDEYAVEEDGEDEPGAQGGKKTLISRFRKVNEERKANAARNRELDAENRQLRERLEAFEAQGSFAPEEESFDLATAEAYFADALLAGDTETAQALRQRINLELLTLAERNALLREQEAQVFRFAEAEAEQAVARFPFLDVTAREANKEAIAEVVQWRDFLLAQGLPLHDALREAAERIGRVYAPLYGMGDGPLPADGGMDRARAAVLRNARAANAQPPLPAGVGDRSRELKMDVETMSEDDWDNLPKAARDRLLGISV